MVTATGRSTAHGPIVSIAIILTGIIVSIIGVFLVVNPAGVWSEFYIQDIVRVLPIMLLGIVGLFWPRLILLLFFVSLFGGDEVNNFTRQLTYFSPTWSFLLIAGICSTVRSINRPGTIPWVWVLLIVLLATWAFVYESEESIRWVHGVVLPLVLAFSLVMAVGTSHSWKEIKIALVVLYATVLFLVVQLVPLLFPSWGTSLGLLRDENLGFVNALQGPMVLCWIFNAMAVNALGMSLRLDGRFRIILLAAFLVFAMASLLTFSRGTFLGIGAGLLVLIITESTKSMRVLVWLAIAAVFFMFVAYFSGAYTTSFETRGIVHELTVFNEGTEGRISTYWAGIKEMPNHVLVGRGAEGTPGHSFITDSWNNYGSLYFAIFITILITLFRRSKRLAKDVVSESDRWGSAIALGLYASFACSMAQLVFDATLFSFHYSAVFWFMRGLEIGIWKLNRTNIPDSSMVSLIDRTRPPDAGAQKQRTPEDQIMPHEYA